MFIRSYLNLEFVIKRNDEYSFLNREHFFSSFPIYKFCQCCKSYVGLCYFQARSETNQKNRFCFLPFLFHCSGAFFCDVLLRFFFLYFLLILEPLFHRYMYISFFDKKIGLLIRQNKDVNTDVDQNHYLLGLPLRCVFLYIFHFITQRTCLITSFNEKTLS